jgi:hypothetical protein
MLLDAAILRRLRAGRPGTLARTGYSRRCVRHRLIAAALLIGRFGFSEIGLFLGRH